MTWAEFKKKWSRYQGKETSAYQSHFDDLCRMLGQPTPSEADPSGNDFFCYQKHVIKNAELLGLEIPNASDGDRGFADVWKKDCFGWGYKAIAVFRDECREHLPWEEAQTYLRLFESHRNWEIFERVSLLKKGGRVPSPRFEKALESFYWSMFNNQ